MVLIEESDRPADRPSCEGSDVPCLLLQKVHQPQVPGLRCHCQQGECQKSFWSFNDWAQWQLPDMAFKCLTSMIGEWITHSYCIMSLLRQDPPPLEAILVIFGRRALIFFCLKALGKNEKWRHFCAHAQWWSPWRRKNVEKGHLAPSNLTFLIIAIDTNGFRRMKEEGLIYKTLPQIF